MKDEEMLADPGTALFNAVQSSQGFAFVSDGNTGCTLEEAVSIAESSLYQTRRTANQLQGFIRRAKRLMGDKKK